MRLTMRLTKSSSRFTPLIFGLLSFSAVLSAHQASEEIAVAAKGAAATAVIDPTKLLVGDKYFTATSATNAGSPKVGYVYNCYHKAGSNGASSKGPWFNSDGTTWNSTTKINVQGSVAWVSTFATSYSGTNFLVNGNGLPSHKTGTFPIASSDPAYTYDRNPNPIQSRNMAYTLSANPVVASKPTCIPTNAAIGILFTGSVLWSAADAAIRDAAAWEIQDSCGGHPNGTKGGNAYHYHTIPACVTAADTVGQHSPQVGMIADGFGIYGNLGENGKALTNADLDSCHGHTHSITVNGQSVSQYHYHKTLEFPYTVGCYKGTPKAL